jgi:hypothetical protein
MDVFGNSCNLGFLARCDAVMKAGVTPCSD